MSHIATVTVGGNAIGGSCNADQGVGGNGVKINFTITGGYATTTQGALTVNGSVTGGKAGASTGSDGDGILLAKKKRNYEDNSNYTIASNYGTAPTITVGAYDSIRNQDLCDEDMETLLNGLTITGLPSEAQAGETDFWQGIYWKISNANKGDKITINAGSRTVIPTYIMKAACEYGVTLIIRWDGGNDVIINTPCKIAGGRSFFLLSDLAELYSK